MFSSTTCKAATRCLSSNSSSFAASASLGRGRRQHQQQQRRARGGQKVQRNNHLVGSVVVASSSKDEDEDDYYSEEQYEWEVGGPNDVAIPHLMNIYKGEKPLKPLQTSFCAPHSKTCLPRNNKTRRYFRTDKKSNVKFFVDPGDRVMLHSLAFATSLSPDSTCELPTEADEGTSSSYDNSSSCTFTPQWVVRAGPREKVYFAPEEVHAAIVTCGGLCPGINDVIRSIVGTLEEGYGVTKISGIRYGFSGFWEEGFENIELSKKVVSKAQARREYLRISSRWR